MLEQRITNGTNLGFENELWQVAYTLRFNIDAAEYKHRNYNFRAKKFRVFTEVS